MENGITGIGEENPSGDIERRSRALLLSIKHRNQRENTFGTRFPLSLAERSFILQAFNEKEEQPSQIRFPMH